MINNSCIYTIRSILRPTRFYVGSAKDWNRRRSEHKFHLNKGTHHNIKLQNHVNKYGIEDLEFVKECPVSDIEQLIKMEQFFIDSMKPYFNICPTAGSPLGRRHTKETKEKIRKAHKGRVMSDESRRKLSLAKKGISVNLGRKATSGARLKMRIAKLGKKASEKTKSIMSLSAKQGWEKRRNNAS